MDGQQWQLGQWGEREVRSWLERDCGMFVVPTTCIEDGGAPALTRLLQRHVLPDFQAFGEGHGHWWEVKTKTRPVYYQKQREHRHGIAERLWNAYVKVANTTGLPGHLAIVQLEPRMLLAASFSSLTPLVHTGSTTAHGERMIWFRVDDFDRLSIGSNGPCLPPPRIEPKSVRPWEVGKRIADRQPSLWEQEEGWTG